MSTLEISPIRRYSFVKTRGRSFVKLRLIVGRQHPAAALAFAMEQKSNEEGQVVSRFAEVESVDLSLDFPPNFPNHWILPRLDNVGWKFQQPLRRLAHFVLECREEKLSIDDGSTLELAQHFSENKRLFPK